MVGPRVGSDRVRFLSAISGRVNVSPGRVGSKKSDPWTTLGHGNWHGHLHGLRNDKDMAMSTGTTTDTDMVLNTETHIDTGKETGMVMYGQIHDERTRGHADSDTFKFMHGQDHSHGHDWNDKGNGQNITDTATNTNSVTVTDSNMVTDTDMVTRAGH